MFLFKKIRKEEGGTGSPWKQEVRGGIGGDPNKYTHESKCKNVKKNLKKL
jgi:hypothetical protein